MQSLPNVVTLSTESALDLAYDNHVVASVNDHVVRISTMTVPYHWHSHPNSDEIFLVLEGGLHIDFDEGSIELRPGQMITIPRGTRHRTRPSGSRSVNLTFEARDLETQALSEPPAYTSD